MEKYKQCNKCKQIKPLTEFHKCKKSKGGHICRCKECIRIYASEWYTENHDKIKEQRKLKAPERKIYDKQYYIKNSEGIKLKAKEYQINNIEKCTQNSKEYYETHKEQCKETGRVWAKNNPDKVKIIKERWKVNNPDKVKESNDKKKGTLKEYSRQYFLDNRDKINAYHALRRNTNYKHRLNDNVSTSIRLSLNGNKKGRHWESLVSYNLIQLREHLEISFKPNMTWDNYGDWHIDHIIPISLWNFSKPEDKEFKQCWSLCNLQPLWAEDNWKKGNSV